jgi:hypothetical protein
MRGAEGAMRRAESSRYHLVTQWQFDAPLDAVWDAIVRADVWPGWWSGVERVVTLEHGDARAKVSAAAISLATAASPSCATIGRCGPLDPG